MQLRTRRAITALPMVVAPVLTLAVLESHAGAAGETQASSRLTLFDEPAARNEGVRVLHPQVDASAALGSSVNLAVGYNVDIVTGATPKTYGVDAVSSATKFHDTRQSVHGGLSLEGADGGIGASYAYSWEADYRSHALTATTHHDLYEHNFTLALAYTHNWDSVCDNNNAAVASQPIQLIPLMSSAQCFTSAPSVVSHRLHIDFFEPSLSWTMTPRLVVQGGTTIQILDGFQSNPYRDVALGMQGHTPQEHHPQFRQRYAVFGRIAYAFPELRASAHAMLRLYDDSWAVKAVTGDILANKYIGQSMLLALRAHYHTQTGASFYRSATELRVLGPTGQYWTGDRELSPMSNYLLGGRMAFLRRPQQERSTWFVEMEADVKYELLLYQLATPDAPNADRKFAHIVQGAFALRF